MRCIALGCFSLLLFTATANAEWLEASSDHFVIYSDQDDAAARRFAERLERFHGGNVTCLRAGSRPNRARPTG